MNTPRNWHCGDPGYRAAYASATREALRCLEGKWKIVVLCQLFAEEALRFSELERLVAGVTQKMLVQQLRELEQDGIVRRTVYAQVPPKVEYSLTQLGRDLGPAITALMNWAETRREKQGAAPLIPG